MSTPQPEASTKYSRARGSLRGLFARPPGPAAGSPDLVSPALLMATVAGSVILLVAEFTPLLTVETAAHGGPVQTVGTGPHHGWAMIPIALLALVLAGAFRRARARLMLAAIAALGLVALLLALIGDLPDAEASSQLLRVAGGFVLANASPSTGLYLETLGAILLLIAGGAGLLLLPGEPDRARAGGPRPPRAKRPRPSRRGTRFSR